MKASGKQSVTFLNLMLTKCMTALVFNPNVLSLLSRIYAEPLVHSACLVNYLCAQNIDLNKHFACVV